MNGRVACADGVCLGWGWGSTEVVADRDVLITAPSGAEADRQREISSPTTPTPMARAQPRTRMQLIAMEVRDA